MRFLDLAQARAYLSVQREGARLLQQIISGFDLTPLPDGSVRLSVECSPELVDRLAVWGACIEDDEDGGDQGQTDADCEADGRDLPRMPVAGNVIVPDDLIERHEIRTVAREQLEQLRAEPRERPLPALTPREGDRSENLQVRAG